MCRDLTPGDAPTAVTDARHTNLGDARPGAPTEPLCFGDATENADSLVSSSGLGSLRLRSTG
jgi:hypothetical protein